MRLTFDDGPSEWTAEILDLLAEAGVRATFFCCGAHVEQRPELVARTFAEGHLIGNHTWGHRQLPTLTDALVMAELVGAQEWIARACGERPAIWRAPYLERSPRVDGIAASLGLEHVGADVKPDDFAMDDPEAVAAIVLAEAGGDSIVCLHDGVPPGGGSARCLPSRAPTVEAVRLILQAAAV